MTKFYRFIVEVKRHKSIAKPGERTYLAQNAGTMRLYTDVPHKAYMYTTYNKANAVGKRIMDGRYGIVDYEVRDVLCEITGRMI